MKKIKDLPEKIDFNNPNLDKLNAVNIHSLVSGIKEVLLTNHTVGDISEDIQIAIDESGIKMYNVVSEDYDNVGNAIVKLVNFGYSVGVANGDMFEANFDFAKFFDSLKDLDHSKINNKKLPKYVGSEIEHCSITAVTNNINDTFKNIVKYHEKNGRDRFTVILGKCYQYGSAALGQIVDDYRKSIYKMKKGYDKDSTEYFTLTLLTLSVFRKFGK